MPYSYPLDWSKVPYPINIGGGDPLEARASVSTFCIKTQLFEWEVLQIMGDNLLVMDLCL